MNLPTGVVTFLLTDIEGSARLWEEHPEEMRHAVAAHNRIAAAIVDANSGVLVKARGEGDSLFAVFSRATDALAAACSIQLALCGDDWEDAVRLRVRMALHTGEADCRESDYFGPAVNRCARLRAIAHGMQVILSLSTAELVRDSPPRGTGLLDLGPQRLRDLMRPEHVFQLLHPGLPAEFPPVRSLNAVPNNLPVQPTSFVGREKEIREIRHLIQTSHLLTLTGSGGCGKSRLAAQVGAATTDSFPDGVWLVELAPLADPDLVTQAAASTIDLREDSHRPVLQVIADHLKTKEMLLILDNCEHVLIGCARLADALLKACPDLRILAGSREALGIMGETTYHVPSLSLPDPDRMPLTESLSQYEAVRLFIDRAVAAVPQFAVTNANAPAVAQICCRLDGIPLAIELAAIRIRAMSVEQIASRLDARFRLLTGGSKTALPKHQTLHALVDWSHDLLPDEERIVFRRLSVFQGSWRLEAAESICAGGPIDEQDVVSLLTSLVSKSLVSYDDGDGQSRYRLLETIRQYAAERLEESGEAGPVHARHLSYYTRLVTEADAHVWGGSQQTSSIEILDREHDNIRSALAWSVNNPVDGDQGLRIAVAMWYFWNLRGYVREGRGWLSRVLDSDPQADARLRAQAQVAMGWFDLFLGEGESALRLGEASLAVFRRVDDGWGVFTSLSLLAMLARMSGDPGRARELLDECLFVARGPLKYADAPDSRSTELRYSLMLLTRLVRDQGDLDGARSLAEETLAIARESDDHLAAAMSLSDLGLIAGMCGDYPKARSRLEESLSMFRALGGCGDIADTLCLLGDAERALGDLDAAHVSYSESLAVAMTTPAGVETQVGIRERIQYPVSGASGTRLPDLRRSASDRGPGGGVTVVRSLLGMALVLIGRAQHETAARLLGTVESYCGSTIDTSLRVAGDEFNRAVDAVRSALGERGFASAWSAGKSLTLDAAIALALPDARDGSDRLP